jgi:hypothetical protein
MTTNMASVGNTHMALIVLTDRIASALDNGDHAIGVFLDFSKAFDTVDHAILLHKLEYYGVRGPALLWMTSYMSNRKQFVVFDGIESTCKSISYGVPQGSDLAPLLFLLDINEVANVLNTLFATLFADDINVFLTGNYLNHLFDVMNAELIKIILWLNVNKLSLNL